VLGLLVSRHAYPLAYDIFEGNKYEGDTFLPILEGFRHKYHFEKLTVIADAGLLSKQNVEELSKKGYEFILGARIKNEKEVIKKAILKLRLKNGESRIISKEGRHSGGRHTGGLRLVITYSEDRAKKDSFNRQRGLKRLEKQLRSGKLTKSGINNKGYNKFLKMEGDVTLEIDQDKVKQDERWDGLKGYLTNSSLTKEEVLENYRHLWQIEKAFRVAKNELRIRPIFHRKKERIEAHICLNFTAYKI